MSNLPVPYLPETPSDHAVVLRSIDQLTVSDRHVRMHPERQIELITKSILRVGFTTPIIIGTNDRVLAGAARLEAARRAGMTHAPTISLAHLPHAEQRAYMLADNKLAEMAAWDDDVLKIELQDLATFDLAFDLTDLGFATAELDLMLQDGGDGADTEDTPPPLEETAVTRLGDVWDLGPHRLICADARDPEAYLRVMKGEKARMVFADPPFNVPIRGHVMKRGSNRREFPMAVGEMSSAEFVSFLAESLGEAAAHALEGSIHYVCMDWRHMMEVLIACQQVIGELKNLCVWAKPNAGMGAFYRSQHELVFVFKKGSAAHINNFGLGKDRYRTNIWKYEGASGFHAGRDDDLALHPTAKPVAMIADAIMDVSDRGEIVLDPFGGSGATLMAAEKTGRRARLIELDPLYCDVICRRYQAAGGTVSLEGGCEFEAVANRRAAERGEAA